MFEAGNIVLQMALNDLTPLCARRFEAFHQQFEMHLVAASAAVQADTEHDWCVHDAGEAERAIGQMGFGAEKMAGQGLVSRSGAVAEDADDAAGIDDFLGAQQAIRRAHGNDRVCQRRVERIHDGVHFLGVVDVHQDGKGHLAELYRQRAQHLETAQMRAEQHAAAPLPERLLDGFQSMHLNLEIVLAAGEEIQPVEDGRRKAEIVAIQVQPVRFACQGAAQVEARRIACRREKSRKYRLMAPAVCAPPDGRA